MCFFLLRLKPLKKKLVVTLQTKQISFNVAERVSKLTYAIREFVPLAKKLEREGRKIIYLNIGDPLKYDFQVPKRLINALTKASEEGYNYYSLSEGIPELREAIAEKEKGVKGVDIEAEDVIITHGVSEAINFVIASLIQKGNEALIPNPTYPLYMNYVEYYDGKPVYYDCKEEKGWQPDLDDLKKKISEKTKFILIINPNNPTGALYDEKTIKEVLEIAAENNLPVISDEIYDRLVLDGKFKSTASLTNEVPVIGLNGFSKTFLMTGWRLGYIYVRDPQNTIKEELMKAFVSLSRNRLCASTPIQKAAVAGLKGPQNHIKEMVNKLKERRNYVYERINEIEGLSSTEPKAAFYIFPKIDKIKKWGSDKEFVKQLLLEKNVLVVHGSGFGSKGNNHFRAVFLPPIEILKEGLDKIEEFLKSP